MRFDFSLLDREAKLEKKIFTKLFDVDMGNSFRIRESESDVRRMVDMGAGISFVARVISIYYEYSKVASMQMPGTKKLIHFAVDCSEFCKVSTRIDGYIDHALETPRSRDPLLRLS
jgi:hypothetical protein